MAPRSRGERPDGGGLGYYLPNRRPVTVMRPSHLALLCLPVLQIACGGGGSSAPAPTAPPADCTQPCTLTLAWTANRETGVNAVGGGYTVHYATTPNVALDQTTRAVVAYDPALGQTPTAVVLTLAAGTWYLRVTAFSALNPGGSAPSAEVSVMVGP